LKRQKRVRVGKNKMYLEGLANKKSEPNIERGVFDWREWVPFGVGGIIACENMKENYLLGQRMGVAAGSPFLQATYYLYQISTIATPVLYLLS